MEQNHILENKNRSPRPIRILGIAPYKGMKAIMQGLAAERDDIDLDVFIGDLEQGVEIAQRNIHSNYDIIISRGGTAELINQITHIPVIEVALSVYDILRAIKLAQNYADRYAIMGFPGITENAHLLCDLLQYKIDIFTIHSQEEVQKTLKELKRQGYRMVLCDMITNTTAKRLGMNAILITSGTESISAAFDQAVKLSTSYASIKAENNFFSDILRNSSHYTLVLRQDGEIFFSSFEDAHTFSLLNVLKKELTNVLNGTTLKFFRNVDGTLYSFTCCSISLMDRSYGVFYFTSSPVPLATSKYGIRYSNQQEAEDQFFNSFYSITSSAGNLQATINNIDQTAFPIMLSGESGSGQTQAARIIYSKSQFRGNPLISIDCSLINDKSWNFITNHYNSPFNDNNNTIYLSDITALPENRLRQLLSIIIDTGLCRRNRVILSCSFQAGHGIPSKAMEFVNQLSCITVHLSPLRDLINEIPTLSSLYLNTINFSMTNQIIGFEPEAMELLKQYDWPYNYTQFKRVLNELALITTTPYIQANHVATLLEKERSTFTSSIIKSKKSEADQNVNTSASASDIYPINLNRTLEEITNEIIHLTLERNGGNQSAAAKKLGIGRTTLWRYLK